MFETIVWATDGSELSDRALAHAKELAQLHHSRIVAVHANERLYGRYGGAPLLADEPELVEKIEGQVAALRAEGFDAELDIESGGTDVAQLIAKAAREADADVIVVATHGHGGFVAAVLGSVARALLHAAPCPVLVIPPAREQRDEAHDREVIGTA